MVEIDKFCYIDSMIRFYGKVTTRQIEEECGIKPRTIKNYIAYMKSMLNAPIEYSYKKKGYIYKSPFEFFIGMNEKLLMNYTFLKSIIKSFNYVPFVSKEIDEGFRKFISKSNLAIAEKIEYELSQFEVVNEDSLTKIFESFKIQRKIQIKYTNQNDETKELLVEPLKLINYQGNWFLIGHLSFLNNPTIFNFSRISSVIITEIDYENKLTPDFLKQYLNDNFGIFKNSSSGEDSRKVIIRFYETARVITRNQTFHTMQTVENGTDPDKGEFIQFTIPVKHYDEILGKVLLFGPDAEVVGPDDFREIWQDKIREMFERYCK